MTVPLPSSLSPEGLSAHSHTPTRHRFTAQFDGHVPYPTYPAQRPVRVHTFHPS